MKNNLKTPLRGIIPPLITPLSNTDELDVEGLERLIEHVISGGVHGIFILGTTGEFSGLSYKLKIKVIEKTCKLVNRRVPVLVGISDCSYTESINLARKAADFGADAVVLVPMYYFSASQVELLSYLKKIVKQLPLPLFLYNIPVHTKVEYSPETVKQAAEMPGVIGIKDSSFNLAYLKQIQYYLKDRSDFTYLVGPEQFMAEFVLTGGHGGVTGGANMFPKLYVDLYKAAANLEMEKVEDLQQKVMQVCSTIYQVGQFSSSYLKGLKCALSVIGICDDLLTEPFEKFNLPERKKIEQALEEINYKTLL